MPAPNCVKSALINVRNLLGRAFHSSIVPGRSPPGVLIVMVPVMTRVLTFSNAARPPMAAMLFSISSSAVCDEAVCAEARANRMSTERIAYFMAVSPLILRCLQASGSKYESEFVREARILGAVADVNALRWIEVMPVNQHNSETRQRFTAPASRRPGAVGATREFDREVHSRSRRNKHLLRVSDGTLTFANRRLPRQHKELPPTIAICAQHGRKGDEPCWIIAPHDRRC